MPNYHQKEKHRKEKPEITLTIHYMMRLNYDKFMQMLVSDNIPLNILKEIDNEELFLEHKIYGPCSEVQDQSDKSLLQLISQPINPEELNEFPLAIETIARLMFIPTYEIKQQDYIKTTDSLNICRDIRDMLEIHKIAYFITIEYPPENHFIAGGYNPRRDLRIENQRPDLFLLDELE